MMEAPTTADVAAELADPIKYPEIPVTKMGMGILKKILAAIGPWCIEFVDIRKGQRLWKQNGLNERC